MEISVETRVLSAMRRLIRATDLSSKRLARQTKLSTSQLLVLELLSRDTPKTVGGIADEVGLAQATVTTMLDRLEERQLLTRARSDADRRQVNVFLTADGARLREQAPAALQTRFLTNFAQLEEWERLMILSALNRIADLMEARDVEASPVLDVGIID